jgi:hypothetical protein
VFLVGIIHSVSNAISYFFLGAVYLAVYVFFQSRKTARAEEKRSSNATTPGSGDTTALATARAEKPSILAITFYLRRLWHAGMGILYSWLVIDAYCD